MARVRDMQRSKIFEAEASFIQKYPATVRPSHLTQRVTGRMWWARQMEKVYGPGSSYPTVSPFHTGAYGPSRQCLPRAATHIPNVLRIEVSDPTSVSPLEILHSLAHVLLGHDVTTSLPHEPDFVNEYLSLVGRFYGQRSDTTLHKALKAEFLKERVRTKTVTDATREKQRDAFIARTQTPSEDDLRKLLEELKNL